MAILLEQPISNHPNVKGVKRKVVVYGANIDGRFHQIVLDAVAIILGIILFWVFFNIKNILWLSSFFNSRRGFYYFGFLTMFIFIFSFIGIHTLYNRLNYHSWDIPRGLSIEEKSNTIELFA